MTIDELEACTATLFKLREHGITEVDTGNKGFYWLITWPDWTDIAKAPGHVVGSLDDDLSELGRLLKDPGRSTSVDLERLASTLRLLSDVLAYGRH